MHRIKRFFSIIMVLSLLTATNLFAANLFVASAEQEGEKPLLTIACLSDLHNQERLITDDPVQIRGTIASTLTQMKNEEENIDAILIGGDVSSDSYTTEAKIHSILDQIKSYTDPITNNVFWVTGNHDYNAGEGAEKYNSAPYYEYIMKNSAGPLAESDSYYETYNNEEYLLAYHYVVNGYDFVCINTSPADMAGGKQHSNYVYTDGVIEWMRNKLAEIGRDKRIFLLGHIPLDGQNSMNSNKGLKKETSDKMINVFKDYPYLIYLYGHDHGGGSAYIREDTIQRVTEYDVMGNIIGGGVPVEPVDTELSDALVWKFEASGSGYTLRNLVTGKYLGVAANLDTVTDPVVWSVQNTSGNFTINLEGRESVHYSTNTGTFSHGSASSVELYEKREIGDSVTYQRVESVKDGGEYVIVAAGNRALTNKISPANSLRMAAMDVVVKSSDDIAPPALGTFKVDKSKSGYRFASENGDLLGYDGNLYSQPQSDYADASQVIWTVSGGDTSGSFKLYNESKKEYLHYGSSGWSIGRATDTLIYKHTLGEWNPISSLDELNTGDTVMLTESSGTYALTSNKGGGSGYDRRLTPGLVSGSVTTIESVPASEEPGEEAPPAADPGFVTSFVGSMRYYNTGIDGFAGPNNSSVVQALMIYVYSDRVVLQMKNYGTKNGGSEEIAPYIITNMPEKEQVKMGDVDNDGKITVSDVVELRRLIVAGSWTDREFAAGDLDGDKALTVSDVVELRSRIVSGG